MKYSINLDNLKYTSAKINPVTKVEEKVKKDEKINIKKLIEIKQAQRQVYQKRLNKNLILDENYSNLNENYFKLEEKNPLNFIKKEIINSTNLKENILVLPYINKD